MEEDASVNLTEMAVALTEERTRLSDASTPSWQRPLLPLASTLISNSREKSAKKRLDSWYYQERHGETLVIIALRR